ncbi:MAG: hypothetical protein ABEK59_11045 [Halobacteria archaeon]
MDEKELTEGLLGLLNSYGTNSRSSPVVSQEDINDEARRMRDEFLEDGGDEKKLREVVEQVNERDRIANFSFLLDS